MQRVVFSDNRQGFFAEVGLKSFDDFFNCDGERISTATKRDVRKLTLDNGSAKKVFFMKRFFSPHFKDMLFTYLNFGRFCSQAACEWQNANLLLENGIGTYRPICFGEQTKFGIERKSFFITEELHGQCFTDFVAQNRADLSTEQKEKIIVSLADVIRKIHAAQISLPDLYLWHIYLLQKQNGDYEFDFIDLHRMARNVKNQNRQLANLGRLLHSMTDKYFTESERLLLISAYGADLPAGVDNLFAKVKKISAKISAKRNPKPY